jgi:hypothetical protein
VGHYILFEGSSNVNSKGSVTFQVLLFIRMNTLPKIYTKTKYSENFCHPLKHDCKEVLHEFSDFHGNDVSHQGLLGYDAM